MNEQQAQKQLRDEGFGQVFVWEDRPNAYYTDHSHTGTTAHIILAGDMTVTSEGTTRTYRTGDRFDVPAGAVHSARTGATGCRYVVGEKDA